MESHLRRCEAGEGATSLDVPNTEGWVHDLWYQVRGRGPALVLFPVELSAAQWEPIIPRLSQQFTTITLGGERVGAAANLFQRARSPWYQGMLRTLFTTAEPQPGERLLEVGCGSGVVLRWLARETAGRNPITGIDLNRYLLREAWAAA
jgi:hypothetical protein